MDTLILEQKDKKVCFFPKSLRLFEVNDDMEKLISKISSGLSVTEICSEFEIDEPTLQNIINTLDEYDKEVQNEFDNNNYLNRLSINISNTCNMKCAYCYANFGNYGDKNCLMDIELIKTTLDKFYNEFEEIGIIQIFGGEPLLNFEGFKFICEYIEQKFLAKNIKYKTRITTVTNGTVMSDKIISLIKRHNVCVTVSVDGPDGVHDKNRSFTNGKATFDLIMTNIKRLRKETKQPEQIEVTYNQSHMEKDISIVELLKYFDEQLGKISLHIAPVSLNKEDPLYLKSRKPFVDSVENILELKKETGKLPSYVTLSSIVESLKRSSKIEKICAAGVDLLSVSTKGDIYPCYMFIDVPEFLLLNVKDKNFSRDLLNELTQKYREYDKREQKKCASCFAVNMCTGCMGINYYSTGDIHIAPNDSCSMNREVAKKVILNIEHFA